MLLPPVAAPATIGGNPNPNGFSYSGGPDKVYASNINKTYDEKMYFATYFQDDWKMTPKLTMNLGVRWDYFGPINEQNGGQANFVPDRPAAQGHRRADIHRPCHRQRQPDALHELRPVLASVAPASSICWLRMALRSTQTNRYGQGLLQTQKQNFAPRVGFAYRIQPEIGGARRIRPVLQLV